MKKALGLKEEANAFFKSQNFEDAEKKYLASMSTVRACSEVNTSAPAKTLVSQCRANLSLCLLNQKKYDECIN
jgi:hypothetical protein